MIRGVTTYRLLACGWFIGAADVAFWVGWAFAQPLPVAFVHLSSGGVLA